MSAKTVDGLFEAFSQGDGTLSRKYGGTGLGLAISKKLVALMDGSIGVRSDRGKGSVFWFSVPLEIDSSAASKLPLVPASLAGCRALVVDDNESNRRILAAQMGCWSMDVTTASGAAEGLSLVRAAHAANRPYHVILLDYQMPGIDGLDLARIMRADPALAATPIFLLTPYQAGRTQEEAARAGVDVQMTKPVRLQSLWESLGRLLTEPQRVPAAAPPQPSESKPASPEKSAARLLLVEDHSGNRKVALKLLDRLGYACDIATDGEEALSAIRSQPYDLVLMDVQMPRMDGLEATAAIRQLEGGARSVRIVAMTANAMVGDRDRCLAAGMDDYLSKPFRGSELNDILKRWLTPEAI